MSQMPRQIWLCVVKLQGWREDLALPAQSASSMHARESYGVEKVQSPLVHVTTLCLMLASSNQRIGPSYGS